MGTIPTISSREFNQDSSGAKRAAESGPVIITDRGQPAHVLMSFAHYQQLLGTHPTLAELLTMPAAAEIDLDSVLPVRNDLVRAVAFD